MAARVGDRACAACPLYPSGRVLIGNVPHPARAAGGSIEAGSDVIVVGGDKFSLLVRVFDPTQPVEALPNYGQEVLIGKEHAVAAAASEREAARQSAAEYRRDLRRLTTIGLAGGFMLGLLLIGIQTWRVGFALDLLIIPPLASVGFAGLAAWFLWFGGETNEAIIFFAVLSCLGALAVGMFFFGPLVGVVMSLVVGFGVSLLAVLLVALKGPIA